MTRLAIALFGPPGAGKTTIARQSGLTIYDRDDPQWKPHGEAHFRQGIRHLASDPHAAAVVIRSGSTSSARRKTIGDIAATHAYLILTDPATCHYRVGHRRREDQRTGQAAVDTWYARFDHDDQMPTWPGNWDLVRATPDMGFAVEGHPMVHQGRRPEHRRGTVGRPWRRFRTALLAGATHCGNCGEAFITDATCRHPTHAAMPGCPTHPRYPTVEHPDALVDGGAVRDAANALVWCFECNTRAGSQLGVRRTRVPLQW